MTRIVLRPNASLSECRTWCFVAGVAAVTLSIALGFAVMGYWLVLPFAGLEIAALVLIFRFCLGQNTHREVVSIDGDKVRIEAGKRRPERSWEFVRTWTQVLLQPAAVRGYPSRLVLGSAGQRVELGAFLTEDERKALWYRLKSEIEDARAATQE
ncbi:MAG: DUF2244 domain-containing protein [Thiotrichales bacterium]